MLPVQMVRMPVSQGMSRGVKVFLWILCIVVVAGIVGVGIWWYRSKQKKSLDEKDSLGNQRVEPTKESEPFMESSQRTQQSQVHPVRVMPTFAVE